ncbi:MAG: hypothetical protein AAGF79_12595 [Pseudomonadota bacterium]
MPHPEDRPVARITGASGGLGSVTAQALTADGYRLALMSHSGCGDIAVQTGGFGVAGSVLSDTDVDATVARAGGFWPHRRSCLWSRSAPAR